MFNFLSIQFISIRVNALGKSKKLCFFSYDLSNSIDWALSLCWQPGKLNSKRARKGIGSAVMCLGPVMAAVHVVSLRHQICMMRHMAQPSNLSTLQDTPLFLEFLSLQKSLKSYRLSDLLCLIGLSGLRVYRFFLLAYCL